MVISFVLFACLFVCVRAFSFETIHEENTIIHHESCQIYLTHRHEYLRQYCYGMSYSYIGSFKSLWGIKSLHIKKNLQFIVTKKINQKRKEGEEDKAINMNYTSH